MAEVSRKLTKRVVDAAESSSVRYILWDSDLKGSGLRIETSGTKSYLVRYRPRDGKRVIYDIADLDAWVEARKRTSTSEPLSIAA